MASAAALTSHVATACVAPSASLYSRSSNAVSAKPLGLPLLHASKQQQRQSRAVHRRVVVRAAAEEEGATAAAAEPAKGGIKREEEKFAVINTGKWECKSCGYIYDQFKGDPSYPVAPGVALTELPDDWLCPTCGSAPSSFGSLSKELAGFAQNQAYGLGGNSLTSAQKGLLIWGSIFAAFLGFVSGYFLDISTSQKAISGEMVAMESDPLESRKNRSGDEPFDCTLKISGTPDESAFPSDGKYDSDSSWNADSESSWVHDVLSPRKARHSSCVPHHCSCLRVAAAMALVVLLTVPLNMDHFRTSSPESLGVLSSPAARAVLIASLTSASSSSSSTSSSSSPSSFSSLFSSSIQSHPSASASKSPQLLSWSSLRKHASQLLSLPASAQQLQQQASEPSTVQAPNPTTGRTAVCLTGSARDFELTGPSIVARLLPGLRPYRPVLFLVAPLDEHSHKLWALQWGLGKGEKGGLEEKGGLGENGVAGGFGRNLKEGVDGESAWEGDVELGAVEMGGSVWVDGEEVVGDSKLYNNATARSMQPQLQYLRLPAAASAEGREAAEVATGAKEGTNATENAEDTGDQEEEEWVVPFGSDYSGVNDAFGMGSLEAARKVLSRLSSLQELVKAGLSNLSPEATLQARIESTGVHMARADWPLCTVSHQTYKHGRQGGVLVASLQSRANLNGAKCWPCTPKYTGLEALSHIAWAPAANRILSPSANPLNSGSNSIQLCHTSHPWELAWTDNYDAAAGTRLAGMRRAISSTNLKQCVQLMGQLQRHTASWSAPPPAAICVRSLLGKISLVGSYGMSFPTALAVITPNSVVLSTSRRSHLPLREGQWESRLSSLIPGLAVQPLSSPPLASTPAAVHLIKFSLDGSDLPALSKQLKAKSLPPACQLLVAFPKPLTQKWRSKIFGQLESLNIFLATCLKEFGVDVERCLFFSVKHCTTLLHVEV
ncbi:unnamed protein product [Closterium sp. Yama58-4]|nr:unnamed protein product [Closterium sp. Yama58-4]